MSWVAELKASRPKNTTVHWTTCGAEAIKATPPSMMPSNNCMAQIH